MQSNRFLPCYAVWSSRRLFPCLLLVLSLLIAVLRATSPLFSRQTIRRLAVVRVPLGYGQVGNHTPSPFIQGRSFHKTPWHPIYKNLAGKCRHLLRRLGARCAIRPAYQQAIYTTNEDLARPPLRQKQKASGRPRRPMSRRQSHLISSVLL